MTLIFTLVLFLNQNSSEQKSLVNQVKQEVLVKENLSEVSQASKVNDSNSEKGLLISESDYTPEMLAEVKKFNEHNWDVKFYKAKDGSYTMDLKGKIDEKLNAPREAYAVQPEQWQLIKEEFIQEANREFNKDLEIDDNTPYSAEELAFIEGWKKQHELKSEE